MFRLSSMDRCPTVEDDEREARARCGRTLQVSPIRCSAAFGRSWRKSARGGEGGAGTREAAVASPVRFPRVALGSRTPEIEPAAGSSLFSLSRQLNVLFAERSWEGVVDVASALLVKTSHWHRSSAFALTCRAHANAALGKPEEALADFARVHQQEASAAGAMAASAANFMTATYHELGRRREACAHSHSAMRAEPKNAGACYWRAAALRASGDDAGAAAALRTYLTLETDPRLKAQALIKDGKLEAGVAECSKWVAADPLSVVAIGERAKALVALGRHEQAIADLSKMIQAAPANTGPLITRCACYRECHMHSEAVEDCSRWRELDPSSASALSRRVQSLQVLGRHKEAIADCNELLALDPSSSFVQGILAASLESEEGVPLGSSHKRNIKAKASPTSGTLGGQKKKSGGQKKKKKKKKR
jgi:tetratricopeptide (TPR) repeat protein